MKTLKPLLLAASLAMSVVGCASGVKYSEYRPTVSPPPAGNGRIWFYRPSAMGAAIQPEVNLDGRTVGHAKPHGFFHVDTLPGEHEVKCTTEWSNKNMVTVATNQDSYVRLSMMIGVFVGHVIPKQVPAAEAEHEMKNLHLMDGN